MIQTISRLPVDQRASGFLKVADQNISHRCLFLDLEHYIYKRPVCIGIFGGAVLEAGQLEVTQYFLESRSDLADLIKKSHAYLSQQLAAGRDHLVTFAGENDLGILRAMFDRFDLGFDFNQFTHLDLQKQIKAKFGAILGLKVVEELLGIEREVQPISGSTLAKTFATIMKDDDYIHRMPPEKIQRFLSYNRSDVANLYEIMANFEKLNQESVKAYLDERLALRLAKQAAREAEGEENKE